MAEILVVKKDGKVNLSRTIENVIMARRGNTGDIITAREIANMLSRTIRTERLPELRSFLDSSRPQTPSESRKTMMVRVIREMDRFSRGGKRGLYKISSVSAQWAYVWIGSET